MSRALRSGPMLSARRVGVSPLIAFLLVASPSVLKAQWIDSLPSVSFATTILFERPADPPYASPDSLIRPPQHRIEWALVGAIVTGASAWCTFDFLCAGANDYGRTRFTLSAAALGAVAGYLFGETLFGSVPANTEVQPEERK